MPRFKKAIIGGLLTGLFGLVLMPLLCDLEEGVGLDLLFRLRGTRDAPSDVVVVTLDKESADNLNLPPEPYKWPRSLHARLVDNLSQQGAALIAFDMIFKEAGPFEIDNMFAEAIHDAGNVVLCEQLDTDTVPLIDGNGNHAGDVKIESCVPLVPRLARSAVACAPFPLPKVPVKVSQCWAFKQGAGDIPTFPVVSFQVFALEVYDEFLRALKKVDHALVETLPANREAVIEAKGIEKVVSRLRHIFQQNQMIAEQMLEELGEKTEPVIDSRTHRALTSLINMYQCDSSHYLNFYGPPGAVYTIPYYQLIPYPHESHVGREAFDFNGKAVFIGLSERLRPEEKDGFYTAFSNKSGVDISGVEIAATAFANILENRHVQPFSLKSHICLILFAGLLLGVLCRVFPNVIAAIIVLALGALYLSVSHHQFKMAGTWFPLVVPLFVQAPVAFFGTVLWKYLETHKERQNVRKALGYYVPGKVVDQMAKTMRDIRASKEVFQGTCLCTDAEKYTSLSEQMEPEALGKLMNEYFEAIFKPVKRHKGKVSEVVGDSMIAIWPVTHSETSHRVQACLAALEISQAVDRFNRSNTDTQLPTRIGLHTGQMMLGNIGAMDRYEYNPVGDIVNTASRIEGLNKHLETRILASQEVVYDLDEFVTREMGEFILKGKTRPVVIYELIGRKGEAGEQQRKISSLFPEALNAYRRGSWGEGIEMFSELTKINGSDGPSRFYLKLCEEYLIDPPEEPWDGLVRLNDK